MDADTRKGGLEELEIKKKKGRRKRRRRREGQEEEKMPVSLNEKRN